MISLIGFNFFSDGDSLNPMPTNINEVTKTTVKNGIFDHVNISQSVTFDYSSIQPDNWDIDTILNATFDGKISAGNVDEIATGVTGVRIKRRVKGEFDWITLKEIPIETSSDLSFVLTDNLNAYNVEYEYAFVPLTQDIEGNYVVESILSKFDGVFICDVDTVMKIRAGVEYSDSAMNQQIGVFQPYNRQYPIVVSNSLIQYKTGTIGGWVLPESWEDTREIDRVAITQEKDNLLKFLTNKKPKIIKDTNGNNWLVFFTGNPSVSYANNFGQGMVQVSAGWTEIGSVTSKDDLYNSGLIPTKR